MTRFYETLPDERREALFARMRGLSLESEYRFAKARELTPPASTIVVGGADFDEVLKGEVIASYLRAIRQGKTPTEALAITEADRTSYVRKWNKRRGNDYVVHRSETDAEQSLIERVHRQVMQATEAAR